MRVSSITFRTGTRTRRPSRRPSDRSIRQLSELLQATPLICSDFVAFECFARLAIFREGTTSTKPASRSSGTAPGDGATSLARFARPSSGISPSERQSRLGRRSGGTVQATRTRYTLGLHPAPLLPALAGMRLGLGQDLPGAEKREVVPVRISQGARNACSCMQSFLFKVREC